MSMESITLPGADARALLVAVIISLGLLALLLLSRRILLQQLQKRAALDWLAPIVAQTRLPFILTVSMLAGLQFIALPDRAVRILDGITMLVVLVQLALWGDRAVGLWVDGRLSGATGEPDRAMPMAIMGFLARVVLWSTLALVALDNLGVNITALVASMGIGGIAVALALQNVLGDLFASLSIVLDKPFVIGDFIIVDDFMGTVEYVGLKSTRLRSLGGEQVAFANADLLRSRIRNYKRMHERRAVFTIGVAYETPQEEVARIPVLLRDIIESVGGTRFDRAHFRDFGDSALHFEAVYHVLDPDYNRYMDIQQRINLDVLAAFRRRGIQFAYPTRTLHLQVPQTAGGAAT